MPSEIGTPNALKSIEAHGKMVFHTVQAIACIEEPLQGLWLNGIDDYLTMLDERSYFFMEYADIDLDVVATLFSPPIYRHLMDTWTDLEFELRVHPASPEQWARLTAAAALGAAQMIAVPIMYAYGHCS